MDPLQWMGAVRMRVQTADKNITVIHTTLVHQLMSYTVKKCVCKKNDESFTSPLHITLLSPVKKSSCMNQVRNSAKIKHCLQAKTVQNSSKQIFWWILMWKDKGWIFSMKKVLLWITDLAKSNSLKLNANWWTGFMWIIVMFLSVVWTLILTAPIHCRGSFDEQVM